MTTPDISFCIPLKNRTKLETTYLGEKLNLPLLERNLNSLINIKPPTEVWEICIVDFGSTDVNISEYLTLKFKDIQNINVKLKIINESFSRGKGLNKAARIATGKILFFYDADMLITDTNFIIHLKNQVRQNKYYFPICQSYQDKNHTTSYIRKDGKGNMVVLSSVWQEEKRKWPEYKQWGKEDGNLFDILEKENKVIRDQPGNFFHQWHPDDLLFKNQYADVFEKFKKQRYQYITQLDKFIIPEEEIIQMKKIEKFCQENHILFLKTDFIKVPQYYQKNAQVIQQMLAQSKIIVTGNSGYDITYQELKRIGFDKFKKWLGPNINCNHYQTEAIPLGITNFTQETPVHQIIGNLQPLIEISQTSKKISNWAYLCATEKNHISRKGILDHFRNKDWVTVEEPNITVEGHRNFLSQIYHHRFVICPRGSGVDTHRTWESLYLRSIPIVETNLPLLHFRNLPIIFVKHWKDITLPLLEKKYKDIQRMTYDFNPLTLTYWKKKIFQEYLQAKINYKSAFLVPHLGMGDNIILNGMVRELSKKYETLTLVGFKKYQNSLQFMYSDVKNVKYHWIENENEVSALYPGKNFINKNIPDHNIIRLGFHSTKFRSNTFADDEWITLGNNFAEAMYFQAGINYNYRYTSFYYPRNIEAEEKLYSELVNIIGEKYQIVHEDKTRNYHICQKLIDPTLPIFNPSLGAHRGEALQVVDSKNIFDYYLILKNATQLHLMDSSFCLLADQMKLHNIQLHIYSKEMNLLTGLYRNISKYITSGQVLQLERIAVGENYLIRYVGTRPDKTLVWKSPKSTASRNLKVEIKKLGIDEYTQQLMHLMDNSLMKQYLINAIYIGKDGSYLMKKIDGINLAVIKEMYSLFHPEIKKLIQQKILKLKDDLTQIFKKTNKVYGNWLPYNLVYQEATQKIINVDLASQLIEFTSYISIFEENLQELLI